MLLVVTNIAYGVRANRTPHNVTTSTTATPTTPTISTTPSRTLTKSFKLTTQSLTNKTVTAGYQSLTTYTYMHIYIHIHMYVYRDMNQTLAYIQTYLKYITTEAVLWPKLWKCNAICCCLVKEGKKVEEKNVKIKNRQ